ncbi:MAG TPA: cyclic nucleotide-binding domain-containing protein [Brevundimonas sp.]|uniref:patatin-like phospholipase family protein n=1 Tax=Brevundimonas sp. TaxID=1871086 RepID=UPI002CDA1DEA|nr:patatin-like phospholipase family protein [Brevundimonas sp.]HRH19536.1 cyclic nucleotide-binding domain-containing protein [Brevundimonas sp.]
MKRRRSDSKLEADLYRLFEAPGSGASWFTLTGGETLFRAGDPADTLFLVRSGRLGVFRGEDGKEPEFVGVVTSGQPVGEMSLVAGTAHTATVAALRDTEILALPRDAFFEAARKSPDILAELARLMILRTRERGREANEPSVFGFVALREAPIRPFVERVAEAILGLGFTVQIIDQSALRSAAEWFGRVEDAHDFVLYVAEREETAWAALCARQVDQLFLVADMGMSPVESPLPDSPALEIQRGCRLILLRPPGSSITGTTAWISRVGALRWLHAREGDQADETRIARLITGTAVGLVLSGGGARAYAHLGAIRALRQVGTPFDFVGGSSMGAVMAAGLALEWSQGELENRIHSAFVEASPLGDIAFPIISMTRGDKVDELLEANFGEVLISDLPLPYFCVSADITLNTYRVHEVDKLGEALRASISLPGVLPPVVKDGSVLVDGAVLKSFPSDVMRARHRGPIVGVDVSRARGIDPKSLDIPQPWWRWILSGAWRQGPPIVSILMRSATISTSAELAATRAATDVLILPRLDGVEIRDWKAFEPAIAAGEEAAFEVIAGLNGSITHLRTRVAETQLPEIEVEPIPPAPEPTGRRRRKGW